VGEILLELLELTQVIHQCGDNAETGDRRWLEERRATLPVALRHRDTVMPYVGEELASVYAAASLVVGRAGAGTVNECCQLGLPALYVPLPGTSGDEQTANARLVERAGGAVVLPQSDLTPDAVLSRILTLLANPTRLKEMGERARTLARPDAARRIADLIVQIARGGLP
jgi:UDP-N-acetylglucosamine--N-acetylmuramyl-(pentapeptide) pyrophosphoryl-undecaprenol N-acetylglucosamine transferase